MAELYVPQPVGENETENVTGVSELSDVTAVDKFKELVIEVGTELETVRVCSIVSHKVFTLKAVPREVCAIITTVMSLVASNPLSNGNTNVDASFKPNVPS